MAMTMNHLGCVMCGKPAHTTAAQIPVCEKHWDEYRTEARQYLPADERKVWMRLQAENERRGTEAYK